MASVNSERRWSSSSSRTETFQFPDFEQPLPSRDSLTTHREEEGSAKTSVRTPSPNPASKSNGIIHGGRWQQRRDSHLAWGNTNGHTVRSGSRHGRQKSLSDAIRNIRTRKGSVSANAQELADALKAPVSIKLVVGYIQPYTLTCQSADFLADPMHYLVHELCLDQYFLQIHSYRPSKPNHTDIHSIRLRLFVVCLLCIPSPRFSIFTDSYSSAEEWNPIPKP